MEQRINTLTRKVKEARGDKDIETLLDKTDRLLNKDSGNLKLLRLRAELNIKLQKFGLAINDYKAILLIDKHDHTAAAQIEQLQTILKFNNTDIYANPNTNFDPWLD